MTVRRVDLYSGSGRIRHALEQLERVWEETSEHWNDSVSRAFAEEHLEPLVPVLKTTLDAMSRMQNLLDQAQRDCEQ